MDRHSSSDSPVVPAVEPVAHGSQDTETEAAVVTQSRKADHLRICLDLDVQCREVTHGLERYRFTHSCLPELNLEDILLQQNFLGRCLGLPILISSMTGGTDLAQTINYRLAEVAQRYRLPMGVGSQRVAIQNPELVKTFAVRSQAPDILLLANLGAVQLNYAYGVDEFRRAIEILEADALILHLNPLQEAVQTRGDTNFRGLLAKIQQLCAALPIPVIAKEVGNGISAPMAQQLIEAGIAAIDVAGAGGTSWAKVESERAVDVIQARLGQTFADWGLPTADCIVAIRAQNPTIPLIASGGLRNGVDIAKAIALGADLAGLAWPFLQAANQSLEAVETLVEILKAELTTVLFCTGCHTLSQLREPGILYRQS